MKKKIIAIIPARMGSSRFPGKPLVKILDLPMIEHIRRRILLSKSIDQVYVATCDREIMDAVKKHGGRAVMTKDTHERCTDRVEEAMQKLRADIVVIVQGDEPLFVPEIVEALIKPMLKGEKVLCVNLLSPLQSAGDDNDVDIIKTVVDRNNRVLYYSRAGIPYFRKKTAVPVYRQTGISAFSKSFLKKFSNMPPTPMEIIESIDFLRILEHGFPIQAVVYHQQTVGVDRPDDVGIVESVLQKDPLQKKIYQQILKQ